MVKIAEADVFRAVARSSGYRGRQKVNGWYWDNDEIVFCNNIPWCGGEHYPQEDLCEDMSRFFPDVKPDFNRVDFDYQTRTFVFWREETRENP